MAEEKKKSNFTTPILIGLLLVASFLLGSMWTRIKYGEQKSGGVKEQEMVAQVSPSIEQPEVLGEELEPANIGRFVTTKNEICREDGKVVVYMFGRSSCPYCVWEHPIFEKATDKFGVLISVHDNMDKLDVDREIWQEYSQVHRGSVPFLIIGCRYTQLGSGDQSAGEEMEEENLTALICKLTNGQPTNVCAEVQDLIDQIND